MLRLSHDLELDLKVVIICQTVVAQHSLMKSSDEGQLLQPLPASHDLNLSLETKVSRANTEQGQPHVTLHSTLTPDKCHCLQPLKLKHTSIGLVNTG